MTKANMNNGTGNLNWGGLGRLRDWLTGLLAFLRPQPTLIP
jgi:hypothetical protein